MTDLHVLTGERIAGAPPDWAPLEEILPLALCGPFMWMGAIELDDGEGKLGSYKHASTRRYFHLDESARPYQYVYDDDIDADGYVRIRHHDAMEDVFPPRWLLRHATEEEKEALKTAFESAEERDWNEPSRRG